MKGGFLKQNIMKTKEEIFNEFCDNASRYLNEKEALEAMQKYADQFIFEINKLQSEVHSLSSTLDNISQMGHE